MDEYVGTIGMIFIGIFVNTFLYGIVSVQFIRYCQAGVSDVRAFRALFVSTFLVDTAYSALVVQLLWHLCVTNYANPAIIYKPAWPIDIVPIPNAWSALVTQLFLTRRLWRLVSSKLLAATCTLLAICGFALAIWVTIQTRQAKLHVAHDQIAGLEVQRPMIAWLITTVATDIIITSALSVALLRVRTGFGVTDRLVARLVRGAIQTGVVATVFALGCLLSFVCWPEVDLDLVFGIPSGRVYTVVSKLHPDSYCCHNFKPSC
ncbi:hypothetical protein CONPUDRAFT_85854 [Coniophora puteana RWD-64-598 SS2]|uniref:DUF6534 domain-containing protein n=1 Tax=Coniophora puteana (strain RWD-64-598) TaxID=741705 RepID=R7SH27_CONPW|nr:uncharacterized protein CONPUDRAFT_85854 [Coniophora puteana RWD-64-598 SS2]EIW74359.1 hypothetical protein CONPUDRAFT_85854 [Coniophora puteana RWD-64-598 SS2]